MSNQVTSAIELPLQTVGDKASNNSPGFVQELCYSAVRTAVEDPVNGLSQFASSKKSTAADQLHLVPLATEQKFNTAGWYGRQIGSAIGTLPWFLAMEKVAGAGMSRAGLGMEAADYAAAARAGTIGLDATALTADAGAMSMPTAFGLRAGRSALAGAMYEGALKPVNEQSASGFWAARAKNALTGAVTFGSIGAGSDVFGALEGAAIRRGVQTGISGRLLSGAAGGATGGLLGAETGSLLNNGRTANWQETKESLVGATVLGLGMRAAHMPFESSRNTAPTTSTEAPTNVVPRPMNAQDATTTVQPSGAGETPAEPPPHGAGTPVEPQLERVAAQPLETTPPPRNVSSILKNGEITGIKTEDDFGRFYKNITMAKAVSEDGSEVPVVLRKLDNPEDKWNFVKYENGSIAHDIHQRLGLTQPTPAVAERTLSINGAPPERYIVEEQMLGKDLLSQLEAWTKEKYGEVNNDTIVKFVEETPQLKSALEEAFAERHLYGNMDFNAGNILVRRIESATGEPSYEVGNIDWKRGFTPRQNTSWSQEIMQYPVQQLSRIYAGKPMSPGLQAKFSDFLEQFQAEDPIAQRLGSAESAALKARGQSMVQEGFPPVYWITDEGFQAYYTEVVDAQAFWKQKWPQLFPKEAEED